MRAVEHIQVETFLFELAGEIVTNGELIERNHLIHKLLGFQETYTLQLDACLRAEVMANDNDFLCVDTTHYGNVARFLNHRHGFSNNKCLPCTVHFNSIVQ